MTDLDVAVGGATYEAVAALNTTELFVVGSDYDSTTGDESARVSPSWG